MLKMATDTCGDWPWMLLPAGIGIRSHRIYPGLHLDLEAAAAISVRRSRDTYQTIVLTCQYIKSPDSAVANPYHRRCLIL